MSLADKIKTYQNEQQSLAWSGTFEEYIEKVKANPLLAQRAHQRMYNMIMESGVIDKENSKKEYKFFSNEIFGLESVFEQLVEEYFKPAALGLDVRKRLLMLMGPVSGGKSSILMLLKRGMEKYSHTENGAIYAIDGCPMNQDPLLLLPAPLRQELEAELGIKIEGELNPYTRHLVQHTYADDILRVPVKRIFFSEKERVGIGTFSPSDPKSQDISELIGSIDFSTITTYGSESDPRAYRFDGELNIANRGLMEFQEILKCDEKFLWHLLSLTQEGNFKVGRFALVDADEVIIAHTNEAEYKNFVSNRKNEALISRMKVVKVPYNLEVEAEEKIYAKAISSTNQSVDVVPLAYKAVAMFSILTRLQESITYSLGLIEKLRVYNGRSVDGVTAVDLQREYIQEGMEGIDPRFIINSLSSSMIRNNGIVDGLDTLRLIEERIPHLPGITPKQIEHYTECIKLAKREYYNEAEKVFIEMFKGQTESLVKGLLENYIKEISSLGIEKEPNVEILRDVEVAMNVSESEAPEFRDKVQYQVNKLKESDKDFHLFNVDMVKNMMKKITYAQTKKYISINDENAEKAVDYLVKDKKYSRDVAERFVRQLVNSFQ
ncbi:protein prkA [Priestia megaterium]|nr:protein prkA [Priestia megaterium]